MEKGYAFVPPVVTVNFSELKEYTNSSSASMRNHYSTIILHDNVFATNRTVFDKSHSRHFYFIIVMMDKLYSLNPAQIVMYSTQHCPDCLRAKAYFDANDIPYVRIMLEDNHEATEFVMRMNNGFQSVPTIIFPDGSVLVEPSWRELKEKTST